MSQSLVNELIELGAIQFNFEEGFTYASGKVGPHIYCDTRKIIGDPKVRDIFVNALLDTLKVRWNRCNRCYGPGAISLGAILADRLELPFFYVRSAAKSMEKIIKSKD